MSDLITTNFDYTYDGKLATDVIYKPSVLTPEIERVFSVRTGIKSKEQLMLINTIEKVVKAYSSCSRTFTDKGTPLYNRTLETSGLEVNLEWCKDDFEGTIAEEFLKAGIDSNNPEGTPVKNIIDNIVLDAMRRDHFRIFSFGDTTSGSSDYSMLDGLWTRMLAGNNDYCVLLQDQITAMNQVSGSRAIDYFKNLYEGANVILKQLPVEQKKFFVTGNVFENYLTTLETLNSSEGGWMMVQDGLPRAFYRGIEIVPIYAWDSFLADTDNPIYGVADTLILYTTPANHIIGVERSGDQGRIDGWYERKDRKYYVEAQYRLGYNYAHCDLQAISYGNA